MSPRKFSSILPNQSTFFIKNLLMKTCTNCSHYDILFYKKKDVLGYEKEFKSLNCTKFGYKCLVTGKVSNYTADICRNDENLCGVNAKFFTRLPFI